MLTTAGSRRVLFVDSDVALGQSFACLASEWGYHVELASSGRRALELTRRGSYALVLVEASLSDCSGLELLERMSVEQPASVFILMTGRSKVHQRAVERTAAVIASVVVKPWDAEQLALTLRMASELHDKRLDSRDDMAGLSVLIVEDSPTDTFLLEEYLSCVDGMTVAHTECLSDAVRLLHDQPVDIIITDLSLPDARGLDAVLRLRASAPSATLVVCTGLDDETLALQLVLLGAQDYLLKESCTESTLLRTLRFARERKRAEERLAQMAFYDPLTGLANRSKFEECAQQALARARRRNTRLACMFIDLDGFKGVNDRLGHEKGDLLLQDVAERMRQVFRDYDTIARLGGDEFAILLTDIDNYGDVSHIATRLCDRLSEPIRVDSYQLHVTASVGISVYPDAAQSVADLLRCADEAMYDSKRAGKNRFSFFPARAAASA
jgi:two-component system cell cycle response regulator